MSISVVHMFHFLRQRMEQREVFLSIRNLIAALASLKHRDGEVFRRPDGEPYERPRGDDDRSAGSKIGTAFSGALKRAGIKDFRVHDCRHTWASWHYREHRDLIALQRLGGWKTCRWSRGTRIKILRRSGQHQCIAISVRTKLGETREGQH